MQFPIGTGGLSIFSLCEYSAQTASQPVSVGSAGCRRHRSLLYTKLCLQSEANRPGAHPSALRSHSPAGSERAFDQLHNSTKDGADGANGASSLGRVGGVSCSPMWQTCSVDAAWSICSTHTHTRIGGDSSVAATPQYFVLEYTRWAPSLSGGRVAHHPHRTAVHKTPPAAAAAATPTRGPRID